MIHLYLIRHGIAHDRTEEGQDELRSLTALGQQKTQKVAQRLYDLGVRFDLILSSPLVRAAQTATILQQAGLSSQVAVSADLQPEGSLLHWLDWLTTWQGAREAQASNSETQSSSDPRPDSPSLELAKDHALALVGHQPDLSDWAEQLVWGAAVGGLVLKKAGIIGLHLPEKGSPLGNSTLFWLTPPRFLF